MEANEVRNLWTDLEDIVQARLPIQRRYALLYGLLDRVCLKLTAVGSVHYNNLFTRLQVLCRQHGVRLTEIDGLRWKMRRIVEETTEGVEGNTPTAEAKEWNNDVGLLAAALSRFTNAPLPAQLLPYVNGAQAHAVLGRPVDNRPHPFRRFVCQGKDTHFVYGYGEQTDGTVRIDFATNRQTQQAAALLQQDMTFNAVSYTTDADGVLHPELLVLTPDWLMDVSSLTACMQPSGASPLNALLRKFTPNPPTRQTLLGAVAGQFLDDLLNDPASTFDDSVRKCFRDSLLDFCTTDGIDATFFADCRMQFDHIRTTLHELMEDERKRTTQEVAYELEPSFFCPALGLQGRFDMMASDYSLLLELKSGKWDEFHRRVRQEHLLQMLLYKEMLHFNTGKRRADIRGLLLYSKYPYLLEQRSAVSMLEEVMSLRNGIVCMEQQLAEGHSHELLDGLTAEQLLTRPDVSPNLWSHWLRPGIEAVLAPLRTMDTLTGDYFHTFLAFIEREQMMTKLGDQRIGSTRCMASLWNADETQKRENGDMLTGLTICDIRRHADGSVEALRFQLPDTTDSLPNFRKGDSVVLYERDGAADNVTHHPLIRCSVEEEGDGTIWLRLRHRQRLPIPSHPLPLPKAENCRPMEGSHPRGSFAIEPDSIESSFRPLYQGLHALVTAPAARRELLLCQRPSTGPQDYQLIVGPPGTGKTSVALARLVKDSLLRQEKILLLAYTNRAVDEICGMLERQQADYIRIGRPLTCDVPFRPRLLEAVMTGCQTRRQVCERFQTFHIVVGTVSSVTAHQNLFRLKRFDVAYIDEASQILEPQILPILCAHDGDGHCYVKRWVMIGDHKQLPAVVMQSEDSSEVKSERLRHIGLTNCRNSLFERLLHFVGDDERIVHKLYRQGRMHEDIAQFASRQFYDGLLRAVPLQHQQGPLAYQTFHDADKGLATARLLFVNVPAPSIEQWQPKMNVAEAQAVADIVKRIETLAADNRLELHADRQIGIIVPFRRQILQVRHALSRCQATGAWSMMIDTVERFQGSQRDIIIYATTISRPYELEMLSNLVEIDGQLTDRKLNVAVTRARKQLIVVGNRTLLSRNPLYHQFISCCRVEEATDTAIHPHLREATGTPTYPHN